MRQVAKRGILTAVATGSVLASTAGYAYASAEAQGGAANSPGVGSGNAVQAPVDVPVNACGNTVSVVGLLNPAMGKPLRQHRVGRRRSRRLGVRRLGVRGLRVLGGGWDARLAGRRLGEQRAGPGERPGGRLRELGQRGRPR